jgi:hypothetical protein
VKKRGQKIIYENKQTGERKKEDKSEENRK